eukprot:357337_1
MNHLIAAKNHLLFSIFVSTLFLIPLLSQNYDGWIHPQSPKLPRPCNRMAVGYDYYTDTIRILGGEFSNKKQLISYKNNLFIDHGEFNLSYNIYGAGQYYKQIENVLWMIDESGDHLNTFDLNKLQLQYNYITIPLSSRTACLTSFSIQNNNYLAVIGGINGNHTSAQIFNINSSFWVSNVPNMQQPRKQLACAAHNQHVFAIGGEGDSQTTMLNSIEILNISDIDNIQSKTWSFIDNLLQTMSNNQALVYGDDILVIGGHGNSGAVVDQINVINTITNTISLGGYLSYHTVTLSSTLVFPYIYIFGKSNSSGIYDEWQYHILPTTAPTSVPTNSPTLPPYTKILAAADVCFSAKNYDESVLFNAPINGEIIGIELRHSNGTVSCNNVDFSYWGCNDASDNSFFIQFMKVTDNVNYIGDIYYPTNDTINYSVHFQQTYSGRLGDCQLIQWLLTDTSSTNTMIKLIEPSYDVQISEQFMIQYNEAYCAVSIADNTGTSCVDVYFLYSKYDIAATDECGCTPVWLDGSPIFDAGYTLSPEDRYVSISNDTYGPWNYQSITFKGITRGGQSLVYKYKIVCDVLCWLQSFVVEGAGWGDSVINVYNSDETVLLGSLSDDGSDSKPFHSYNIDLSNTVHYDNSFIIYETNADWNIRWRSLMQINTARANVIEEYIFKSYNVSIPAGFAVGVSNQSIYILGGVYSLNDWNIGSNEIKKIVMNENDLYFEEILSITTPQHFVCHVQCSVTIQNRFLYILGVNTNGTMIIFDLLTETFVNTSNITPMPIHLMHGSVTADIKSNLIYIVGGYNMSIPIDVIQIFDITNNTWIYYEHSIPNGWVEGAAQFYDNSIFLFGGHIYHSNTNLDGIWKYNLVYNNLTKVPTYPLSIPRTQTRTILVNDYIYIVGGKDATSSNYYTTVDVYDPSNWYWGLYNLNPAYDLHIPRAYHQVILFEGKIFVLGGLGAGDMEYANPMIPFNHLWSENNQYIWVGPSQLSWNDAKTYCTETFATQLASIHNDADNEQMRILYNAFEVASGYIGLTDQETADQYKWDDGTLFDYSNWNPVQPSPSVSSFANCAVINRIDGEWSLAHCDYPNSAFICNAPSTCEHNIKHINWNNISGHIPYYDYQINVNSYYLWADISVNLEYLGYSHDNNHLNGYYLIDELLTWSEGKSRCELFGTTLATITDQQQNDAAVALCNTSTLAMAVDGCFFGLNDLDLEGTFTYVDGTNVNYTNWECCSQPNMQPNPHESCGRISLNGKWYDDPCLEPWDFKRPILCNSFTKGYGTTYILSFSPFKAEHISNNTNPCINRLQSSFKGKSFNEWWRYSNYPFLTDHLGIDKYLAYPPSGSLWTLTGFNPIDTENRCNKINYHGKFTYNDFNECLTMDPSSSIEIEEDSTFINVSAILYVTVVSPTSINPTNNYYTYSLINKSFTMSFSKSHAAYTWYPVKINHILSTDTVGVNYIYESDINGNVVIVSNITQNSCAKSHIITYIDDNIDGSGSTKWDKIRYTQEYWGESQCWSILGDNKYGSVQVISGLYGYNSSYDVIIDNKLLYGCWDGEAARCDTDSCNFWNGNETYKGSMTVQLRRNISHDMAGIGTGNSCVNSASHVIRLIEVGYDTAAPTLSPTISPSETPTFSPSINPSNIPSFPPSHSPSQFPTKSPSNSPSAIPSNSPSHSPSAIPSNSPSVIPSNSPSTIPSDSPSVTPSNSPSHTPSTNPSNSPTNAPSFSPSLSPTQPPSHTPSIAPSLSPTACIDLHPSDNTNDGVNELNVTVVTNNIKFMNNVSMIIDGSAVAAFTTDIIYLNDSKPQLICSGIVACFQSNIICATISNNSFCNILCSGYLGCSEAIITANNVEHLQIICNGEESCKSTQIIAQNVNNMVIIDCVKTQSCESTDISLDLNTQNIISCYSLQSCENINIFTTDYRDTVLKLYSY